MTLLTSTELFHTILWLLLATDVVDYLVLNGAPFREAHHVVGKLVALSEQHAVPMDKLPYEIASTAHAQLGPDWTSAFDLARALAHRERPGMPGPRQTEERIRFWRTKLG